MKRLLDSPRWVCGGALATAAALMAGALYMQHGMGMEPCPLCVFQRVALMATGAMFLGGLLTTSVTWLGRGFCVLALVASGAGAALAGRHLWLQNLPPDRVPECGPGLDYLMDIMPLQDVFTTVLSGSGECAEVSWRFLGLSIPGWTLLAFAGFIAAAVIAFRNIGRQSTD